VPPVQPFYDHQVMLDEMEDAMATTEFLKASPKIQQLFGQRWAEHSNFLAQEAQRQQMAMNSQAVHSAVAQATQQSAAMAAADAVDQAMSQVSAQRAQPTEQYVASAAERAQRGPDAARADFRKKASPAKRKVTIEEQG
jgi:predicted TIM-barrel fold metal-dependent hydrolase